MLRTGRIGVRKSIVILKNLSVVLANTKSFSQPTKTSSEPEIVYTLPSRIPDQKNIHHAHVIVPDEEEMPTEEPMAITTGNADHEIANDVVEEAEKSDEVEFHTIS